MAAQWRRAMKYAKKMPISFGGAIAPSTRVMTTPTMLAAYGPRAEYYEMAIAFTRPRGRLNAERVMAKLGYTAAAEPDVHRAHFHVIRVNAAIPLTWDDYKLVLEDWLRLFNPRLGRRDWIICCLVSDKFVCRPLAYSIRSTRNGADTPLYFVWQTAVEVHQQPAGHSHYAFDLQNAKFHGVYSESQPDLESFIQCCIGAGAPLGYESGEFSAMFDNSAQQRNQRLFCTRFLEKRACTELWTNFCGVGGRIRLLCSFAGEVKSFEVQFGVSIMLELAAALETATPEEWRRLLQWLANQHYEIRYVAEFALPPPDGRVFTIKTQPIWHTGWLVNHYSSRSTQQPEIHKTYTTVIAPKSGTAEQREQLVEFWRAACVVEPLMFTSRTLLRTAGYVHIEPIYALFVRCMLCFAPLGFPELIARRILEYAYPKFLLMYESDQTRIIASVNAALETAREARAKEAAEVVTVPNDNHAEQEHSAKRLRI